MHTLAPANAQDNNIYFRQSTDASDISQAKAEVTMAFPHLKGIQLHWVYIVTWHNVTFYNAGRHPEEKRNTFQAAITTNGIHSFTIFYYNSVTWTTGDLSDGKSGLGGKPAQAGFDAGDGKNRLMIDGSCTGDILAIANRSNVNSPGKWIFRVDDSNIQTAGCTSTFAQTDILKISPSFVNTFGHVPITISGPCIHDETTTANCRFFNSDGETFVETPATITGDFGSSKAVCTPPFLFSTGKIRVDLVTTVKRTTHSGTSILEQGQNITYSGSTFVTQMSQSGNGLQVNTHKDPNEGDVRATFSWDPNAFGDRSNKIDLQVVKFDLSNPEKPVFEKIEKLATGIRNQGTYMLKKSKKIANILGCNVEVRSLATQVVLQIVTSDLDMTTQPGEGTHFAINAGIEGKL